jgi:hypothetical protein
MSVNAWLIVMGRSCSARSRTHVCGLRYVKRITPGLARLG